MKLADLRDAAQVDLPVLSITVIAGLTMGMVFLVAQRKHDGGKNKVIRQVSGGTAQEGGGVYQNVYLAARDYSLTVDIAAADDGTELGNGEAGLFELMLDGVVVDSYDFGAITSNATKHSLLAAMPGVTEGNHEVRIRITRPVRQELSTVTQYLDNVVLIEGNTSTKGSGNNTSNGNGNSPDCTGNKGGNRDSDNSGGSNNKGGDKHCD